MIYPIPQKQKFQDSKIDIKSISFAGDFLNTAYNVLKSYSIPSGDGYVAEIHLENSKKTTYIDSLSRLTDEKYFIEIKKDKADITVSSRRGAFRAVHTLLKMVEKGELFIGEIEDYPLFEKRGYIEGFYGKTWEQKKRLSVMSLMAKYGMNTFYYAPKDDEYHREKWREAYPEKELSELKALFNFAEENELDFSWCIGPGLTYHYKDENDFDLLIQKIKSVYDIGVRRFGLLLDDIPWDFQYEDDTLSFDSIVDAHIDLINKTYLALKTIDTDISLIACPTEYFGDEDGYYISKLGKNIPSDVDLFWTGEEICSRVLTCRESDDFLRATAHKPYFWDNYPVNDCEMFQEMHLGAYKGRDRELFRHCEGLICNVMEYAECSKIPLMTIADFLWNPLCYNAETSLLNAQTEILGNKNEKFKFIADHLCVSCLDKNGSQMMSDKLYRISFLKATGNAELAIAEFDEYRKDMRMCLEMLEDTSVELFCEIKKWTEKFSMCCDLLDLIFFTQINPTEENRQALATLLQKYTSDAVLLTGFCLREAAEKTLKMFD